MAKYRTKVEYVDAEQFLPPEQVPNGVNLFRDDYSGEVRGFLVTGGESYIIYSGDWVVKDKDGNTVMFTDNEFSRAFEPLENQPPTAAP